MDSWNERVTKIGGVAEGESVALPLDCTLYRVKLIVSEMIFVADLNYPTSVVLLTLGLLTRELANADPGSVFCR